MLHKSSKIEFASKAEHVGVIRSEDGNLPNLLNSISSHKKALGSVISAGLARGHAGNPAASIRVEKLYGTPVLMSGLESLFLEKSQINLLDSHYKITLENLQRLHPKSPRSFVLFLSGSLPAAAILRKRQFSLFSMICLLPKDPLNIHARHILTHPAQKSWFCQIREICELYNLPTPLSLLQNPMSKDSFKKLVKTKVLDSWQDKLRKEAAPLDSLKYFKPGFMSLHRAHPLWTTAGCSPYETRKATIQARMLSGRFRTEYLARHWSENKEGFCLAPTCKNIIEDIEHILVGCPALKSARSRLVSLWETKSVSYPILHQLITTILVSSEESFCQFVLDPSVHPLTISLNQKYGNQILKELFYLTRTWCFTVYKERMTIQGKWNLCLT